MRNRTFASLALLAAALLSACSSSDDRPFIPTEQPEASKDQEATDAVESGKADATDAFVDQSAEAVDSPSEAEAGGKDDVAESQAPEATIDDSASDPMEESPADVQEEPGPDPGLDLGGGLLLRPSHPVAGQPITLEYQGTLAGSSNVSLHYGYNGWNEVQGVALTSQDDGTSNLDFFAEQALAPLPGGGWGGSLTLPAEARSLHVVLFTEQGGERTWDNNGGYDYNAGFPLIVHGPVLTWDGVVHPQDGVVVNFHTGWPCKARVEFGPGGSLTQSEEESSPSRAHFVRLQGLQPDTAYSYHIVCDALEDPPTRIFRTAAVNATKYSFAVLGDIQETGEAGRWKRTADLLLQEHPEIQFVLSVGDMPWNDRPGPWWSFFDQGRELLATKVWLPALGNHDLYLGETAPGKTSFERWFALDSSSGSERYYVQRYGSAGFLVLDSQVPTDFTLNAGAQFLWASQRLSSPPLSEATWVFVSWHDPPYNAGARHWGEQGTFRDMTSLLEGKVDWLFSGHEHLYQRNKPLRYNGVLASSGMYGRGANAGVGYLLVPPAGAWPEVDLIPHTDPKAYYRERLAYPTVASDVDTAPSENGFVVVEVDGATIHLETWAVGGPGAPVPPHLVDQVTYSH